MKTYLPDEIEKESFKIISDEMEGTCIDDEKAPILKRVIHATADFEYVRNLTFSKSAVQNAIKVIKNGVDIVTDTQMVMAGINKAAALKSKTKIHCFISDEDVKKCSKERGVTRSSICMEKAVEIKKNVIIAVGNAPTALIRLNELIKENKIKPILVIGVPVGFVNVVESKELIMNSGVEYIVAKGRKGGSNVAAAIVNALLYMTYPRG
ncbi:MAG: precorrin-8X methylmutase [Clostridiales bacterium]